MNFIYFGEHFSDQTGGWIGTFTDVMTGMGVEWPAVQAALLSGEDVQIRQATCDEMAGMEMAFADFWRAGQPLHPIASVDALRRTMKIEPDLPVNYTPKTIYTYGAPRLSVAQEVALCEREMLKMPQAECPVIHRFGPGVYIREVMIPAGTFAIGHHQNFEHQNIMLKGRVTVQNDDGSTSELAAPMIFIGKPGRKIGYIHEDIVWLNVYATNETDVETLERTLLTKSDAWIENGAAKSSMALLKNTVDSDDYRKALAEFGFTEELARAQAYDTTDITDLPFGGYKIMVSASPIEGRGLFATACIEDGEIIAPARIDGMRTIAGRYTNHSITPNALMVQRESGDIDLVATGRIKGCAGGQPGEEITINYRDALSLQISREKLPCQE